MNHKSSDILLPMPRLPWPWVVGIGLLLAALFNCAQLRAAELGRFETVIEPVRVVDAAGKERRAMKGGAVEQGDRVATGKGAMAQIKLSDGGFLAIRSNTEMVFKEYRLDEKQPTQSSFWVELIKGGFRSITGLIGKLNPGGYRIETEHATIGVRGTDHEPFHIPPPKVGEKPIGEPGTYDKLNSGRSYIRSAKGVLELIPGRVGYVPPADVLPRLLPAVPDFFKEQPPVPNEYLGKERAAAGKEEGALKDPLALVLTTTTSILAPSTDLFQAPAMPPVPGANGNGDANRGADRDPPGRDSGNGSAEVPGQASTPPGHSGDAPQGNGNGAPNPDPQPQGDGNGLAQAPGQTGTAPGHSGDTPQGNGNGGSNPDPQPQGNGNGLAQAPGQGGTPPGQGGTPPGQSGANPPGNGVFNAPQPQGGGAGLAQAPGQGGTPPGQSGANPPGNGVSNAPQPQGGGVGLAQAPGQGATPPPGISAPPAPQPPPQAGGAGLAQAPGQGATPPPPGLSAPPAPQPPSQGGGAGLAQAPGQAAAPAPPAPAVAAAGIGPSPSPQAGSPKQQPTTPGAPAAKPNPQPAGAPASRAPGQAKNI